MNGIFRYKVNKDKILKIVHYELLTVKNTKFTPDCKNIEYELKDGRYDL